MSIWVCFPQGVRRLYLCLLSMSHWLLHGVYGQNELVSLNGNFGMSDKVNVPQAGPEGSIRMAPRVPVSRSSQKKSTLTSPALAEAASPWVCLGQCHSSTGDMHFQYPPTGRLPGWAIHWEFRLGVFHGPVCDGCQLGLACEARMCPLHPEG